MSAIIGKILASKLLVKLTKIIIISVMRALADKTETNVDNELVDKIEEALNGE